MFSNFAWSEMLVIATVAIIVIGPKDLPAMLRQMGKAIGSVKRMAGDFQRQFNDAIKETELDEIKNITSSKGFGPLEDAKKSVTDLQNSITDPVQDKPANKPDPKVTGDTSKMKAKPAAKPKAATSRAKAKTSGSTASKPATTKATTRKTAARKPAARNAKAKKPVGVKSRTKANS